MGMDFEVADFVAEFDGRGRAVDVGAFAERVWELRWRADVRVVLMLLDGESRVVAEDEDSMLSIERARLPVVCSFEGTIEDDAARLVMACDVRMCAETASLADWAEGGMLSAAVALAQRLVSRVVPVGEAASIGRSVARTIGSRGPYATQLGKEALRRGGLLPLEQALRFETDLTLLLQTTKDRAEGVRAFIEKRAPIFGQDFGQE